MRNFFILFRYERRSLFPSIRNRKIDIIGGFLSLVVSLAVIGIFALLVYSVAESYVTVKVDKISAPTERALELLNALYTVIIVALGVLCLEKMRTNLVRSTDKSILLRLPVRQSTIFLSKFAALLLWTYSAAIFLIIPVNAIFYFVLKPGLGFITQTLLVYLLLPLASFLIATLLIVPYISVINFLSAKYFLTFITLSGIVIGAFLLYSMLLSVLQGLFETSSIKFLFSNSFVESLQTLEKFTYPANALASIALGVELERSLMISGAVALVALVLVFFVTRSLYKLTLYKNSNQRKRGRKTFMRCRTVLGSLMRKEFISVFREPRHLFSYFAIAISMPFMVYCCYTLFDTLIFNALGLTFEFALALIVVLVFTILTNTFCATNVTRDGLTALKVKAFPVKASKILFSKVLFCSIISSISVVASVAILYFVTGLDATNAIIAAAIGVIFSISQIFIATRMDLNHAVVNASPAEIAKASNRTIAKVITVGLFFAMMIGFVCLFVSVFAGASSELFGGIEIKESYIYLIPAAIAFFYFLVSLIYYSTKIEKSFRKLVR